MDDVGVRDEDPVRLENARVAIVPLSGERFELRLYGMSYDFQPGDPESSSAPMTLEQLEAFVCHARAVLSRGYQAWNL